MKPSGPIEKKAAYPAGAMLAATVVLGFIAYYAPRWNLPPAWLVASGLTVIQGAVAYFAPHTHLRPASPVINVTGDPTKQPAIITMDGPISEADFQKLKDDWRRVFGVTQVQPDATITGKP
jgi:hypothetical protein